MFSLRKLHETARSILFELENLTPCYTHKEADFKDSQISVWDDMCCQPDLLTRSICSQHLDNVKVLLENGFSLDKDHHYPHKQLINVLHWAFYANNARIFKFFIKNGCALKENDAFFYDPKYKKNFKFSILLYALKNKAKFKNFDSFFENLNFDDFDFMLDESIYERLGEPELIEMFESMFELGFSLNEKLLVVAKYTFGSYLRKGLDEFMCSQLFVCLYQNGIRPNLIDYLVNKYAEKFGLDAARDEIVQVVCQSDSCFHLGLFFFMELSLKTSNLIMLLRCLFLYLNRSSVIKLRKMLNKPFHNFANFHFMFYFDDIASPLIENDANYKESFLFKRKYFQIFELFLRYCVFEAKDFYNIACHIGLYVEVDERNLKKSLEFFVLFVFYFLENELATTDFILEWAFEILKSLDDDSISGYSRLLIEKLVYLVCETYKKTPKSLLRLCRQKIRDEIQVINDEDLNKLDLPKELNLYLRNTLLIDEDFFYSNYEFLFNRAKELLE